MYRLLLLVLCLSCFACVNSFDNDKQMELSNKELKKTIVEEGIPERVLELIDKAETKLSEDETEELDDLLEDLYDEEYQTLQPFLKTKKSVLARRMRASWLYKNNKSKEADAIIAKLWVENEREILVGLVWSWMHGGKSFEGEKRFIGIAHAMINDYEQYDKEEKVHAKEFVCAQAKVEEIAQCDLKTVYERLFTEEKKVAIEEIESKLRVLNSLPEADDYDQKYYREKICKFVELTEISKCNDDILRSRLLEMKNKIESKL